MLIFMFDFNNSTSLDICNPLCIRLQLTSQQIFQCIALIMKINIDTCPIRISKIDPSNHLTDTEDCR